MAKAKNKQKKKSTLMTTGWTNQQTFAWTDTPGKKQVVSLIQHMLKITEGDSKTANRLRTIENVPDQIGIM